MDFGQEQRNPGKHMVGIGVVLGLHVLLGWALLNGLAQRMVEVIKGPIETKIIEEVKPPPPPPPENLPPPPKFAPPPPSFVPPPEVVVNPPPTVAPVITTTTVAPPPAPVRIAPPPVAAPPAPPAPPPQNIAATLAVGVLRPPLVAGHHLLVGTWNIQRLSLAKSDDALCIMAAVVAAMDVVAIQEV